MGTVFTLKVLKKERDVCRDRTEVMQLTLSLIATFCTDKLKRTFHDFNAQSFEGQSQLELEEKFQVECIT